jgi:UDP:flavonoid glycosyltransferase YjiC (YdhE family)
MRYLFTFTGGSGHFLPTVPFATGLRDRGHEVRFACQPGMIETVERAGFVATPTGGGTLLAPGTRRPLVRADRAGEQRVVRDVFAGRIARERAHAIRALALDWCPDVVVRDEMDFGAAVAAESADVVHGSVTVIAAGGFATPAVLSAPLGALRADLDLDPDPELAMLHRYLTITPVPPSFRDPADPLPPTAHHVRPAVADDLASAGRAAGSGRRAVYLTLGTIFGPESGDLFSRALAGLRQLDVDVLVTVGPDLDPAELGPQPDHVRVERFVPLAQALKGRDVVISHAGSGTMLGSLACGLPLVLLPMGADQPWNADRCATLGVARVLDPVDASADGIAAAVNAVLAEPGYRAAAHQLRDEIAAMPGPELAVELLERLGVDRQPVPRVDGS